MMNPAVAPSMIYDNTLENLKNVPNIMIVLYHESITNSAHMHVYEKTTNYLFFFNSEIHQNRKALTSVFFLSDLAHLKQKKIIKSVFIRVSIRRFDDNIGRG